MTNSELRLICSVDLLIAKELLTLVKNGHTVIADDVKLNYPGLNLLFKHKVPTQVITTDKITFIRNTKSRRDSTLFVYSHWFAFRHDWPTWMIRKNIDMLVNFTQPNGLLLLSINKVIHRHNGDTVPNHILPTVLKAMRERFQDAHLLDIQGKSTKQMAVIAACRKVWC